MGGEIDVDESIEWMLASKEKVETKLSAQLNKLSLSSQFIRPLFPAWIPMMSLLWGAMGLVPSAVVLLLLYFRLAWFLLYPDVHPERPDPQYPYD